MQIYPANDKNPYGRVRQRWVNGLREKKHPGEPNETALERSLYEESGEVLKVPAQRFIYISTSVAAEPKPSNAYPGILELRTIHNYALTLTTDEATCSRPLPEGLFGPQAYGFIEEQSAKICYALWREIPE